MVGSANDISERKKLEIERATFIEKLTSSNSELERFAYVCSHDLQEPLRMILNYSQRLEKYLGGALDDKGRHYMKYVTDGALHARQLIGDVLNYARVDQETERLADIESEKILAGVVQDLNLRIEETGARITHDALPKVHMQPTHLRQLLQNLIGNALKFCSEAPRIHVGAAQEGAMWRFYVSDNGIGIPPEHSDRIFSIFERLHSRERYPGTGIGLALCRKVALKYGGRIWTEPGPEKGSTFYVTLPPAEDSRSEAA
jgi:light-regulated signal transduction histidine kinase (bacteriophytochrome)